VRHQEAAERLPELLGLRRAAADELALRAHVGECAACQGRLAALERVQRTLLGLGREEPSPALERRVLTIGERRGSRRHGQRARRGVWLAAAAAAVAGLAVALALALLGRGPGESFPTAQAIALTHSKPGVRARLELGRPQGPNQPLRLIAHGLSPVAAPYYSLWLQGPGRRVVAATFRPDADGDCRVVGVVPRSAAWHRATITRGDQPPVPGVSVASGSF
jgi:hypothetical protein